MDRKLYLQHFSIMFLGTILAQIINFLAYPFLSRTYTPENFGTFTIFITTCMIFGAISCGRFDAVIQACKSYERDSATKLAFITNMISSILFTVILLFAFSVFNVFSSYKIVVLLGAAIFFTGVSNASTFYVLKSENYKWTSASNIFRTLFTAFPQVLLYYVMPNELGLIIGFVTGILVQSFLLIFRMRKMSRLSKGLSKRKLSFIYLRYKSYFKVDVLSQILSALSAQSINYFLLDLYSTMEVGYYSMAFRLSVLPLSVFSSSLSQVFFQKASKAYNDTGTFWKEFKFNLKSSSILSLAIIITIFIAARPVVNLYLGDSWGPVADIIILISPMIALRLISVTIATTPLVIGRPNYLLVNNAMLLLANVVPYLVAHSKNIGLRDYLMITTALSSLVYLGFIIFLVKLTRQKYRAL